MIATGWVDCCGSRDRVQGGSCQPAVHGTGTSAQRNSAQAGKPREKKWKGGGGLVYFTQTVQDSMGLFTEGKTMTLRSKAEKTPGFS